MGSVAWVPQEEDTARGFYHSGVSHRVVTSRCSVVGLAIGQQPTEPNRQRQGRTPPAIARQPQYAVPPERPVSWRSTATMNPPRAKPEPASLFGGTRSGSLQDQVRFLVRGVFRDHLEVLRCAPARLFPAGPDCSPLIYPPGGF